MHVGIIRRTRSPSIQGTWAGHISNMKMGFELRESTNLHESSIDPAIPRSPLISYQ
jgi:hypothetical protein